MHFKKKIFIQISIFLLFSLLLMVLNRFFGRAGDEWLIGALALLVFEFINPFIGIFSVQWINYTLLSIAGFVVLFSGVIFFASIISSVSMEKYGDEAMVYLVVMYYPIMIIICGIARLIIKKAKK